MNSLFPLWYRRVLWGAAILACLVSGFVVMMTKIPVSAPKGASGVLTLRSAAVSHVAQGSHFNPAAFPTGLAAQPRLVEAVSPNRGSRVPSPGYGPGAQPRLVEAYAKLPLSFEINKGQTDSQVKFLARGSGYSLFLTGNEAVLALRKPIQMANGNRQRAKGVAQGSHLNPAAFPALVRSRAGAAHPGSADLGFRSAASRVAQGSLFNPAAFPIRRSPGFSPAPFPGLFPSSAAELDTDGGPESDCGAKDLEKPQGLKGEPCATPDPESQAPAVLRMKLVGANPQAKVMGLEELPGKSNYFIGNDPNKWRTNVPNYAKVRYANVYPGVDLVYYGNQGKLEYDFVVQPGADPRSIQLAINSDGEVGSRQRAVGSATEDPTAESQSAIDNRKSSIPAPLHVNATGDLVVGTDGGEVIFHKPVIYQPSTSYEPRTKNQELRTTNKELIDGRYTVASNRVTFEVANYDKTRPLVIDPTLAYSTYLGGSDADFGMGIAVDASDNAYVIGSTFSSNFPTTPGAFQTTIGDTRDAFVSKFNAAGSALIYSTYLGGGTGPLNCTGGSAIAVDSSGNAYLTGTACYNFPTTPGAFQTTYGGGFDGFISKLNGVGSALLYSTYLGGSRDDVASGIAVDAAGNAYVAGNTDSPDFPITPGAFQASLRGSGNAFVSKLNAAGSALLYSTYLGGSTSPEGSAFGMGVAISVDASGSAYVIGITDCSDFPITPGAFQTTYGGGFLDAVVTELNATGSALVYSTYLGGSGEDQGFAIALDSLGNAYVTGSTASSDFPITPGAFQTTYGGRGDAFVSKLNAAGSALVYSTYLGGRGFDGGSGIALDVLGNAYVTGSTTSSSFPTTPGAFQTAPGGGLDAFVSKLNTDGSALLYSTYLGGRGQDLAGNGPGSIPAGKPIAVDAAGNAYVTGTTQSSNFPITTGAFQTRFRGLEDAFISKFSFGGDTTPPVTTASLSGPKGDHGWYRGTVTVTLKATDPDDPVAATYYSVDGGPKQTYSAPFSIPGDGIHQLSFYSVDEAGNQEKPHHLKIKIDATPPTITVAANPATLWPPNGEMVIVSISGSITDATSGVDASSVSFRVTDEYGSIQPTGPVTLGTGGNYIFTVSLEASRRGTDLDGRLYTVTVSAEDNAGNTGSASSSVIVPHDQRK